MEEEIVAQPGLALCLFRPAPGESDVLNEPVSQQAVRSRRKVSDQASYFRCLSVGGNVNNQRTAERILMRRDTAEFC
jgi:hypothetical protein